MDFVPAKAKKAPTQRRVVTAPKKAIGTAHREVRTNERISDKVDFEVRETTNRLGVIEDLSPKFINTDTPKRPLNSAKPEAPKKDALKEAKAKKIGAKALAEKPVAGPVEKTVEKSKKDDKYKMPQTAFINQDKVEKRPLSKNVYRRKVEEAVVEEPKGPVTIISKPEKDSHISVVLTIIITIILGAVAGTVAFLLLPK